MRSVKTVTIRIKDPKALKEKKVKAVVGKDLDNLILNMLDLSKMIDNLWFGPGWEEE